MTGKTQDVGGWPGVPLPKTEGPGKAPKAAVVPANPVKSKMPSNGVVPTSKPKEKEVYGS